MLNSGKFICGDKGYSAEELAQKFVVSERIDLAERRINFCSDRPERLLHFILKAVAVKGDVSLIFGSLSDEGRSLFLERGFDILLDGNQESVERNGQNEFTSGQIHVLTSGTTGLPKLITHTFETINTAARIQEIPNLRWICPYSPGTYAWYQLIFMTLGKSNQELIIPKNQDPDQIYQSAVEQDATAISSTPTFWRYLFLKCGTTHLKELNLRQISLGGEPVDQAILDGLRTLFPKARLTHLFASTETGVALTASDGIAGYPLLSHGDQVKVEDGALYIRSPHAAPGKGGWVRTGDRAKIESDRIFVLGRHQSDVINVGGQKVSARLIEQVLSSYPKVIWCRVYGRKSKITGEIVVAEVCLAPEDNRVNLEAELHAFCRTRLPQDWMVPRMWEILDTIPMSGNFKTEVK